MSAAAVGFGPFRFEPETASLTLHGQPVRLGGKALALLAALLERPGEVLSRDDLVTRVWPRSIVEDTSLRVHISALRRALGDGQNGARYIANVPGRGYSFVGTTVTGAPLAPQAAPAGAATHNLPPSLLRPIGRDAQIDELRRSLLQRRLVSVVGAGGMGKTTVAVATAEGLLDAFRDGVRFVDLSPVSDPARVVSTVAAGLGLGVPAAAGYERLTDALRHLQMLIVLDNCEHVIDAAAEITHEIMAGTAGIRFLATSREALDIDGEWVFPLPPLELPPPDAPADHVPPSVQLFVARATAHDDSFKLSAATAPLVHQVCRQLDGMPLALELAAARVDTLGIEALAARLGDMFRVLTRGRRTAALRHQTLQALLDWSHDLLSDADQVVLRRLAVFKGMFSLEAAVAIAADPGDDARAVMDSVLRLTSKSLVFIDHSFTEPRYRMLAITRSYALIKLQASGEWQARSARHADRLRARLEQVNQELENEAPETIQRRIAFFAALMDDLRGALEWASSAQGDARLGARLMIAGAVLVGQLGLMDEFRPWMEQALKQAQSLAPPDPTLEFHALFWLCRVGAMSPEYAARRPEIFLRLHQLVESCGDRHDKIAALNSLLTHAMGSGDYRSVAELAGEVIRVAGGAPEPAAVFLGERMLAQAHHALGRHAQARPIVERILGLRARKSHVRYVGNVPTAVSLRVVKARIAWMCGAVDEAREIMEEATATARAVNPFVLGHALALGAIPVAMWSGDEEVAARLSAELNDLAHRNSLDYWRSWAAMCDAALRLRMGEARDALGCGLHFTIRESDMACTWDERFVTPQALQRAHSGIVGWSAPEVIRADAARRLREGSLPARDAEPALLRAIALAQEQGAASWELRAASSLALLYTGSGRQAQARELLLRSLAKLVQGQRTRDVLAARALLASLEVGEGIALGSA